MTPPTGLCKKPEGGKPHALECASSTGDNGRLQSHTVRTLPAILRMPLALSGKPTPCAKATVMMNLNTDHLKRCIQTLRSSLDFFKQAAPESIEQEIYRNAIVKGYELTQETSFKLMKKALRDYGHGAKKLDSTPIKDILRLSATHGLMTLEEVERWFAYRDNRNNTAHDYGKGFARETLRLIPDFITDATRLEAELRARFSAGNNDA